MVIEIVNSIALKILNKFNLLKYFNLSCNINISDTKVKIPIIDKLGYSLLNEASREPWLNHIIKSALQSKEGSFIDIGVNIGQTLVKVKSIDLDVEYIGFEPNPICSAYVKKLIAANNFLNCQVVPVGLSDEPSVLSLFMNGDEDTSASIAENFREESFYTSRTYVPVFNGDYLINQLGIKAISVIKIDIEGAELEAIRGLQETISKHQPYILCEILPVYDLDTSKGSFRKKRQDLLEQIIKQEGYQICRILHDGKLILLDSIEIHSDLFLCEYILIPEQNVANFLNKYQRKVADTTPLKKSEVPRILAR